MYIYICIHTHIYIYICAPSPPHLPFEGSLQDPGAEMSHGQNPLQGDGIGILFGPLLKGYYIRMII